MIAPAVAPAVALLVSRTVPADALVPAAETLRDFGIMPVEIPPGDVLAIAAMAKTQAWRAVIVASEDGALPGEIAGAIPLPVVRVPTGGASRQGLGLLLGASDNLPASEDDGGVFATVAIGSAGAKNAALFVVSLLALDDSHLRAAWEAFRAAQTEAVLQQPAPALA